MHASHRDHLLCALVLSLASIGCGHGSAAQPAPASPPAASATQAQPSPTTKRLPLDAPATPQNASIGDAMADHFMITSWARDSVIAGALDALREPLTALADYHYDDVRAGGWLPWLAELQQAARLTSEAVTLDAAAMGVATMGRVCGECHRATHGGPVVPEVGDPLERFAADSVNERMARHMWASELLWEGLVGPSDVTWRAGAKVLLDAPDALDDEMPASFDRDLQEVRALSQNVEAADSLAERANVFGLLIATCADCHTRWIRYRSQDAFHEDEP